jgi:signal transduction histidine kinase
MSLQLRLTFSLLALILLLAVLGWLGLTRLTADLQQAVGESAGLVGRSLVQVLHEARIERRVPAGGQDFEKHEVRVFPAEAASRAVDDPAQAPRRELRVVVNGRELGPEEIARHLPGHAVHATLAEGRFDPELVRFEVVRKAGPAELRISGLGEELGDALTVPLPASPVTAAVEEFARSLGFGLLALALLGLLGAAVIARWLGRPLQHLAEGAAALGRGEPAALLKPSGPPELRACIEAFNSMREDLQRLQREAERAREQRALAELGEIGRGLAHSLRNPLHALGLGLESLAERGGDAALLAQSRSQLGRIDEALRGFLVLASSSSARVEPVQLAEVVDDVLLEASQRAAGSVRFERALMPVRLPAVRAELRILVHTLVMNAVEASPAGACVRIELVPEGEGARLEVCDEGAGVDPAIRARLFEPHVSSKPSGAGMGLFLSRKLVLQRYAGAIELFAREPHGTCARLLLRPRLSVESAA